MNFHRDKQDERDGQGKPWAEVHGYKRYVGSSVKDEAVIDWFNRRARRRLLGQIVADADRLLELARQTQDQ